MNHLGASISIIINCHFYTNYKKLKNHNTIPYHQFLHPSLVKKINKPMSDKHDELN